MSSKMIIQHMKLELFKKKKHDKDETAWGLCLLTVQGRVHHSSFVQTGLLISSLSATKQKEKKESSYSEKYKTKTLLHFTFSTRLCAFLISGPSLCGQATKYFTIVQ